MVVLDKTEYSDLALGHPPCSCKTVEMVGLKVHVFGLEEIQGSQLPIACVLAMHGRMNKKEQMSHCAYGHIGRAMESRKGKERQRDLIVVTFDQRNHGERLVDKRANVAFDENPSHLYDMAACLVGGCHDVSLIIDFLAAYLFPHGERVIDEWVAAGFSLGANVTWRLLRFEPRIRIAMPVCGLPWECFARYVGARAEGRGLSFGPPVCPPSLRALFEAPVDPKAYEGKKILSWHGTEDKMVPFAQGARELEELQRRYGHDGSVVVYKQEGVAHAFSVEAMEKTTEWVWRHALAAPVESRPKM